jgi:plasmid stabilization system protein ParE
VKLVYTDRSKDDLEIAFTWYESQRSGLGFDFLDCIEVALLSILEYPEKHPNAYDKFRRCVIRRFPFSVFYTIEKDKIVVHSVFDNRQDPEKLPASFDI